MNEDRKKRGLANGKFFTAVAICALFLGSGNMVPKQLPKTEQMPTTHKVQNRCNLSL